MRAESSFLWLEKKKKKHRSTYASHFTCNCRNFMTHWNPSMDRTPVDVLTPHKNNKPIFNRITFKYVLAFQVITVWCYSNDISVAPNISGAPASECPQNPFTGHRRKSVPVTFVFSKQYLLFCLVHYLWFQMPFGYFQNCNPFSKDFIPLKKLKKYAIGSKRNPKVAC